MNMSTRIKEQRLAMGLTQEELAAKLGLQKSAIAKYENGRVENIKRSIIEKMSEVLDCKPSYLMGWDSNSAIDSNDVSERKPGVVRIPVVGDVAAGIPIEAIENILDWEEIPESMAELGEHFGLRIKGQSMEPRIIEGDVVIVRQQSDAESGDIVIVKVNGDSATCKRLMKYNDGITLIPLNPSYQPMSYTAEEVQSRPVTIIGKVVELRGKF